MSESIWTRLRKLQDNEEGVLFNLRQNQKGLAAELDNDDWEGAATSAHAIMTDSIRMQEIERELENVNALAEGYERIAEGIELLELMEGKS